METTQSPPPSPSAPDASEPPWPSTPVVTPEPDSRLDQLAARHDAAKAKAAAATAELKEITDGIKTALAQEHPGSTAVLLTSPHLAAPLQLQAISKWTFDAKGCKSTHPQIYAAFARQSTTWQLRALAS